MLRAVPAASCPTAIAPLRLFGAASGCSATVPIPDPHPTRQIRHHARFVHILTAGFPCQRWAVLFEQAFDRWSRRPRSEEATVGNEGGGAVGNVSRATSHASTGLPTADLLAAVEAAVGWRPSSWNAATRQGVLADLDRMIASLETVRSTVLVAEQEAGTWRGSGDPSLAAWRARTTGAGKRAASAQVRRAEGLVAVPHTAQAVTSGDIGWEHAGVIARLASTGTEARQAVVTSAEGQRALVGMARRLDADTFATAAARFVAERDPQSLERDHQAQRAARFLHLTSTPSGTMVKGRLDNVAGHRLRLAVEAVTSRPGVDDDRDAGQRAADALDTIARSILADAGTKPGGQVPPQVTMILGADDWAAARAERDRRRAEAGSRASATPGAPGTSTAPGRSGAATAPGAPGSPGAPGAPGSPGAPVAPATLEDGTPVPGSELARVMCQAAVTRLVIDAESRPLDVGRAHRLFTGAQRRAVVARDRHCAWPDCRMNARWCEVHHLDWWDRDEGRTDTRRGVLLRSFHHHEVHRRDLQLHEAGPTAPGDVALIGYEVRDRTGRLVRCALGRRTDRERVDADRPISTQLSHPPGAAGPPKGAHPPDTTRPSDTGVVQEQLDLARHAKPADAAVGDPSDGSAPRAPMVA